jgi:hypothetical protein
MGSMLNSSPSSFIKLCFGNATFDRLRVIMDSSRTRKQLKKLLHLFFFICFVFSVLSTGNRVIQLIAAFGYENS